ncbi:ethylene-responsive transcription factor ERF015-like [Oryza brachyantha]|uniref:ethylene-responsive transcription factor ERF015-like n=1 Tax=Oryza brachyantha TaxID=4533 RepID=UPI001ADAFDFF|nr:ethylene-responsive transcription factor ERF015-like [Oryza brachyantha]
MVPPPPPHHAAPKNLGLRGVRRRLWGRWAAEIRVPGTQSRLWIGTFPCPRTAALAYDAALYCFHGHSPPGGRAFNFPFAPRRLYIDERRRYGLTLSNIRAIAERYAHDVGSFLFRPPPPPPVPAVFAAAAAAPAPMAAPATDLHHTTTTAAAAAVDPYYYSNEVDNATDEDVIAAADRLLSMDIDEVAALIAIVQQGE